MLSISRPGNPVSGSSWRLSQSGRQLRWGSRKADIRPGAYRSSMVGLMKSGQGRNDLALLPWNCPRARAKEHAGHIDASGAICSPHRLQPCLHCSRHLPRHRSLPSSIGRSLGIGIGAELGPPLSLPRSRLSKTAVRQAIVGRTPLPRCS